MKKQGTNKKRKPFGFYEDHWGFNVHLLVPCSAAEYEATFKEITGAECNLGDGAFIGLCTMLHNEVVIGMDSWPTTAHDFGTLAHEIFHAVHEILPAKGVKFSRATEEAYAYLCGSLFEKCLRVLNENRK